MVEDTTIVNSSASLEYLSSISGSDDSDLIEIYDFHKQETRRIPRSVSNDSAQTIQEKKNTFIFRRCSSSMATEAMIKFLQPKRKLIDPSQILVKNNSNQPVSLQNSLT